MVTLPTAGTRAQRASVPSPKFMCCDTLMQMAPRLSFSAGSLNALLGTPPTTMSAEARAVSALMGCFALLLLLAAAQDRAALKRARAAAAPPPEADEGGDDDERDERARSLSAASASPFGPTFAVRRDLSEFSARGSYGISRAASGDRGGDYTALN